MVGAVAVAVAVAELVGWLAGGVFRIGISSPRIGFVSGLEFAAALPDWKIPPDCRIGVPGLAQDWLQLPSESIMWHAGLSATYLRYNGAPA